MLASKKRKGYQSGNKISLIKTGAEYFSILEKIIGEAKEIIHLQSYILSDDETGRRVVSALKKAHKRGVAVYILIDTYGSLGLSSAFTEDIKKAGLHFRYFAPLLSSRGFHFGRRLHQKVVVIDSKAALIGGINMADRYNKGANGEEPWLDFAVLIEGPICQSIAYICRGFWGRKFKRHINASKAVHGGAFLKISQNDWLRKKSQISKSYKDAFTSAEEYITIVGAYFLPGFKLRSLIKRAHKKGVKIKIILSKNSDEPVFRLAMNYLYGWLIKNGVEVYEYRKAVVHGKAVVADDEWFSIGSHDLNFLSTYGLIEMNADVFDKDLAGEFSAFLENIIKQDCDRVTEDSLKKKRILEKLFSFLAYFLMRFSLWLLIFLFTPRFSQEGAERD